MCAVIGYYIRQQRGDCPVSEEDDDPTPGWTLFHMDRSTSVID